MMTPQLFINYKLKSVAHLPWRMMTYKALNTFIDDIFAFVIKMPTMYRIGCFRDGMLYVIVGLDLYDYILFVVSPLRYHILHLLVPEMDLSSGQEENKRVWHNWRRFGTC